MSLEAAMMVDEKLPKRVDGQITKCQRESCMSMEVYVAISV